MGTGIVARRAGTNGAPVTAPRGYLALVLHAHLPFVRHPEPGDFIEERWLFEALTETYLPLLDVLERLAREEVPFRIALSISPTLLNMLADTLLQHRYVRHLEAQIAFAEREIERTRSEERLQRLALFYRDLLRRARRSFAEVHAGNLVPALCRLQEEGRIEILACAATHGYLPLLASCARAVSAQVAVGVEEYRRFFGRDPIGIWLPECGYVPGLEGVLAEWSLRYFIVEAHGILYARPRPVFATYAPIITPSGVAAFGRDAESSRQVWSASEGYPGDPDYRDFHRDAGFDLDLDTVRALLPASGERIATGFKYHRITGSGPAKEIYDPERAAAKVRAHAAHFAEARERQITAAAALLGRPPIVTAPYDAELFGHWWFEGPQWLDAFIREAARRRRAFALTTPGEYLEHQPVAQEGLPATSSWGAEGYHRVWLCEPNDWIYRHLEVAAERMSRLARRFPRATGLELRALSQAARELLLAQSSDWAFILAHGTVVEYALRRTRTHLGRFLTLYDALCSGTIDPDWLTEIEARDNLFPAIDYSVFA